MPESDKLCKDIITRLHRVEGQIRGLQNMIENNRDCASVITQLTAARGAIDTIGFMIISDKMIECLKDNNESIEFDQKSLDEAKALFMKMK